MIAEDRASAALPGELAVEPEHGFGWLPAVIPADSMRFRVTDPWLAVALRTAGASLVHVAPDVEIGPPAALYGDADVSIAVLGSPVRSSSPRWMRRVRGQRPLPLRALGRACLSLRLRAAVAAAQRRMRGLGHAQQSVMYWDHQMAPTNTRERRGIRQRAVAALPQRALVLGHSGAARPTIVAAARAQAAAATGLDLQDGPVAVRTDTLIVDAGTALLRLGIAAGRSQMLAQRRALALLRAGRPAALLEERIPWELGGGTCGVAEWTLERKLDGEPAARRVGGLLLGDCVDFLVALHGVRDADVAQGPSLIEHAEVLCAACRPGPAARIRALAGSLHSELADLPRGYAHGDFFHGNLLVARGRLTGVVDWEAAGAGRLPLLDLLHLRLTSMRDLSDLDWGPLLARHLLRDQTVARDATVRSYAERIGLDLTPARVRALVLAYWFDYASRQLRDHPHRRRQPHWVERNIELVLCAISPLPGGGR